MAARLSDAAMQAFSRASQDNRPLRRNIGRRRLLGLGAGLAALLGEADAMEPPSRRVVLQLGWLKTVQFGGHFAAIDQGYFAAAHVDAAFVAGGPQLDGAIRVATGSVTAGDSDSSGIVIARAAGMPIKAFAAVLQNSAAAIISLAAKPIRTLKDLEGRTLAAPDLVRPQIAALMMRAGCDPLSVGYVPVGTDPGLLAAGQVDGYYGYSTDQALTLRQRGIAVEVAMLSELGLPGYANVLFATEETLARQESLLVDWLKADIRGWQFFLDHPDDVSRMAVDTYGQRGLDLATQMVKARAYAPFLLGRDAKTRGLLWVDTAVFADVIAFLVQCGSLQAGQIRAEDVVTEKIVRAAHGVS
jgi:ABC-type nitrate/sulfonate/bicarbonate transport system substrate-binding protein